jgi:hypothetical protein
MTLDEAHRLALKILKEVMEEKVDENNIQLAQVSITSSVLITYPVSLIPHVPSVALRRRNQVVRAEGSKEAKFEILSGEATKQLIAAM